MLAAALAGFGVSLAELPDSLVWLCIGTIILIGALIWKRAPVSFVLVTLVPIAFLVYAQFRAPRPTNRDLSLYCGRRVIFRGQVISELADLGNGRRRALIAPYELIFPVSRKLQGKAQLVLQEQPGTGAEQLEIGDPIEAKAFIKAPQRQEQPWQFDLATYLKKQSIFCIVFVRGTEWKKIGTRQALFDPTEIDLAQAATSHLPGNLFLAGQRCIDITRKKIVQAHTDNLGERAGTLLSSMVLGDKTVTVDPGIISDFRNIGLSHLIAASGFNLAVVAAASFWLARCIFPARMFVTCLTLFNMILFVAFAGTSPSVLRAACMCFVLIVARHCYRAVNGLAAVGLALVVTLLIDPGAITDPGCQLSFSATIGIICGAKYVADLLLARGGERLGDPLKPQISVILSKVVPWFVEAFSLVVCAQAAIMPVQLFYFWRVGLLFLPANLIVAPLVTPVTILGFISSLLPPLPCMTEVNIWLILCRLLDSLVAVPVNAILATSRYFASVKQAVVSFGPPSCIAIVFYYVALLAFVFSLRTKCWRRSCFLMFLFAGFLLFWRPNAPQLTISLFSNSTVLFGEDHQGVCIGERQTSVEKFLSYNGVRLADPLSDRQRQETPDEHGLSEYLFATGKRTYTVLIESEQPFRPGSESASLARRGALHAPADPKSALGNLMPARCPRPQEGVARIPGSAGFQPAPNLDKKASNYSDQTESYGQTVSGADNGQTGEANTKILIVRIPEGLLSRRKDNRRWGHEYIDQNSMVDTRKSLSQKTPALQSWLNQLQQLQTSCAAQFIILVERNGAHGHQASVPAKPNQDLLPEVKIVTERNLTARIVADLSKI